MKRFFSTSRTPLWTVVIPVKGLDTAKSRLSTSGNQDSDTGEDFTSSSIASPNTADLALAFALDVISASVPCLKVDQPEVVTSDETVANLAIDRGACAMQEPESWEQHPELTHLSPLNAAIQFATDQFRAIQDENGMREGPRPPIAIVTGDLPCLDSKSLAKVLKKAWAHDRSFVPDHTGLGTTMLCIKDPSKTPIDPRFGVNSAQAHEASGAVRLNRVPLRARLDVDTAADLERARKLGVGIETAKVLEH